MRALGLILLVGCTAADHEIVDVQGRFCVFANPDHQSVEELESALFQLAPEAPQSFRAGDPVTVRVQVDDQRFTNSGTCTPIKEASCEAVYEAGRSRITVRSRLAWDDYDGPCTREAFQLALLCTTRELPADRYSIGSVDGFVSVEVPGTTDAAPCVGAF